MSDIGAEKKRLVINTGLVAIGNMGAKVIAFLLLPLYTSLLTTEEYGDYDYIITIITFLSPIITMCLHEAMFRYLIDAKTDDGKKKVLSFSLVVILLSCLLSLVIIYIVSLFIDLKYTILLLTNIVASILYSFFTSALRGLGKVREYALFSSIKNISQVALNVVAILLLKWGVTGLLLSAIAAELLGAMACIIGGRLWRYISFRSVRFGEAKAMMKYAIPLIPNSISASIINLADRVMITNMIGSDANGIYAIAYKFPNVFETVYHYFYTAWCESSARLLNGEGSEVVPVYNQLKKTINNFLFGTMLVAIAGMAILFRIFVKGDYTAGFSCVPVLMFSIYFTCLGGYYTGIFTAFKKTNVILISTLTAAVVNVVLNAIFLTKWGIIWAATTTLISTALMCLIRFVAVQKYAKIHLDWKFWLTALPVTAVVLFLYDYHSWAKIAIGLSIAAVYAVAINFSLIKGICRGIRKKKAQGKQEKHNEEV